jgi:hypothetical protein
MSELVWQKSSYSTEGANCVTVAGGGDGWIRVRESDQPDVVLRVSRRQMLGLLEAVNLGLLVSSRQ